jgi:peptidoglycan hydrolase CwlO-like protein
VKRTVAGTSVAIVVFGASFGVVSQAARADPIAATKAQISAVQAQIEAGAGRVHSLTVAFDQASLTAANLSEEVSADRAQIAQLQNQVSSSQNVVRREVLQSYTGGAASSLEGQASTGDPSVRVEYLQVATGNLHDALDQFRTQQRLLATAAGNLSNQERLSQAAAASMANARQQALAAAASEQGQLDQLQSQLNRFVEAAAVEAAQRAAAAAAAAAAERASATQGLPVNNGLVAAVHTIVSAPTPSAPAVPIAPRAPVAPAAGSGGGGVAGVWLQLRECESSDNYAANTGNGYYGAYQFSEPTWTGLGYPGRPDLEPPQMQDQAAMRLQAAAGWGQWPACAAALGLL